MAGSSFGTIFRITTWGESHGPAVGVVIDGCPAGLPLTEEDIQTELDRRRPGQNRYTTQRNEADRVRILSGVFEGRTTGAPLSMAVENRSQQSSDYREIAGYYRPGHADYTFDAKYGFRDYRGGGRSSARETIGRVAAGAVAKKILAATGIETFAYAREIASIAIESFDRAEIGNNPFRMPDAKAAARVQSRMDELIAAGNSAGGIIECVTTGLPAGLGDPVFEKLDANLARAILSIGAVKGFEIGDGFAAARADGLRNNDAFRRREDGTVFKQTNHSGGVLGGISDGAPLIFRAAVKPTPSIASPQNTVTRSGEETVVRIGGRHDPLIVPRAIAVVEAMTALTVLDALLLNMTARLDRITSFYS